MALTNIRWGSISKIGLKCLDEIHGDDDVDISLEFKRIGFKLMIIM